MNDLSKKKPKKTISHKSLAVIIIRRTININIESHGYWAKIN